LGGDFIVDIILPSGVAVKVSFIDYLVYSLLLEIIEY